MPGVDLSKVIPAAAQACSTATAPGSPAVTAAACNWLGVIPVEPDECGRALGLRLCLCDQHGYRADIVPACGADSRMLSVDDLKAVPVQEQEGALKRLQPQPVAMRLISVSERSDRFR